MEEEYFEEIITAAGRTGLQFNIVGGWGVDVHLGMQSRAHRDLDLVINKSSLINFEDLMNNLGYCRVKDKYTLPVWNNLIKGSLHVRVEGLQSRHVWSHLPESDVYIKRFFLGHWVSCQSIERYIDLSLDYSLRPNDLNDMKNLSRAFPETFQNLALTDEQLMHLGLKIR